MRFRRVKAQNLRLFKQVMFEPHPRLSIITGANGAGKTTLLEALHLVARGESHRSEHASVAMDGCDTFRIEARIESGIDQPLQRLDIQWLDRRIAIRISDQAASLLELVRKAPVLMLDPHTHELVEQGPGVRRKFVDWGVFHMEPSFHATWRRFQRALKQRNAALRSGASRREIESWSPELAETADLLTAQRVVWLDTLQTVVPGFWQTLIDDAGWSLRFLRGWRDGEPYAETLLRTLESDRAAGHTREGPHRAELRILSDNSAARDRISRGQQKLLIAGLQFAQAELYRQRHGEQPVLLIDDFSAELSALSQQRLLTQLIEWPGQSIVTALEYSPVLQSAAEHAMFHVEHGEITLKTTT